MGERKNLATCKPSEFLAQTGKVVKSVEKWLRVTDIMNIRKRVPKMMPIPEDATPEETKRIMDDYKHMLSEAARQNLMDIISVISEEHPQETLEVVALCCFIDPKNVDDYPVSYYLANLADLLTNEEVISFFTSLIRLEQMNTSNS